MGILLVTTAIILLCQVHGAPEGYVNNNPPPMPKPTASSLNDMRKDWAKNWKITNMKDLTLDGALEQEAQRMINGKCGGWTHGSGTRYTPFPAGQVPVPEALIQEIPILAKDPETKEELTKGQTLLKKAFREFGSKKEYTLTFLEIIAPTQTKFGCAMMPKCSGIVNGQQAEHIQGVCLFGPKGTLSESDLQFASSSTSSTSSAPWSFGIALFSFLFALYMNF